MKFSSSFCFGNIIHNRLKPRRHSFRYRMFMPLVDLDNLNELGTFSPWLKVNQFGIYSFYESDYLKNEMADSENLKQRVIRVVSEKLDVSLNCNECKVLMLSQWRFLGRLFNPITLYYIADDNLKYLCVEVSNTPWKERHVYCYALSQQGGLEQWESDKVFHVSPFNPMDMNYHWHSQFSEDKIFLNLILSDADSCVFNASFDYQRLPFTRKNFLKGIISQPFFSLHTVFGIYWQALKLFLKRIPVYNHP